LRVVGATHGDPLFDHSDRLHLKIFGFVQVASVPIIGCLQIEGHEVDSAGDIGVGDTSGERRDVLLITTEEHVVLLVLVVACSAEVHQDFVGELNAHEVRDLT